MGGIYPAYGATGDEVRFLFSSVWREFRAVVAERENVFAGSS